MVSPVYLSSIASWCSPIPSTPDVHECTQALKPIHHIPQLYVNFTFLTFRQPTPYGLESVQDFT